MKFYNYINENNALNGYIILLNYDLNEVSQESFMTLKSLGDKLGLRLTKSRTVFSLLNKFSKNLTKIIILATKYHYYASVKHDNDRLKEIKKELDVLLSHTNRKEIMSFFAQLDASTLSLLTIPKNILQSIFGIEISTYNDWLSDKDYILTSLEKIKKVLMNIHDNNKEIELLNKFYKSIEAL